MIRVLIIAGAFLAGAAGPLSVELPSEFVPYPELGPGAPSAEAVNGNCLACHSAELVMTQPRLTKPEWAAEVTKMRNVYKAPVDQADDAAIVAWLTAMSERLPQPAG